jgi:hypothetical protein
MKIFVSALFFCIGVSSSLSLTDAKPKSQDFLIDPSKHYVYLMFDHVGDRQPLSRDETSKGLWLRLVNNCRIPIAVAIFDTGTSGPGIGVYDEVVPLATKGPTVHFGGLAKNPPELATPSKKEHLPRGYSLPDTFSTATVSPGESLVFSVPRNHVGPFWSMQIRFYLNLPEDSYGSGPYSVVSFDWQDLPEKLRQSDDSPSPMGSR